MNEAILAIARKVVLCVGLLVAALLFIFPHWRLSGYIEEGHWGDGHRGTSSDTVGLDEDVGRWPIAYPPVRLTYGVPTVVARINYVRQLTEVAIALLFTFGLIRVLKLKKPAGD